MTPSARNQKKRATCRRVEMHVSYDCTNHCVFCSESKSLNRRQPFFMKPEVVTEHLTRLARRGYDHVTFTGGEPTLHPEILGILKEARSLGYRTYVTTNGGLFASKAFCRRALPLIDELCFSVHGHQARLHNSLTRHRRSFATLKKAIQNAAGSRTKNTCCTANLVLSRRNILALPQILQFIFSWPHIQGLLLSLVAPQGNGLRHYRTLAIRLSDIRAIAPAIYTLVRRQKRAIHIFGAPLCALGFIQTISNDVVWSPRTTISYNDQRNLEEIQSDKPTRDRSQSPKCRACAHKDLCGGVFTRYLELFGDAEITPQARVSPHDQH
jgi:molybdenum cofactor biosynthesis enzyme MoaA